MSELLNIFLPLAEKYGPVIYQDIVAAFQKSGYTVTQVDAIFAQIRPYDQLGIDPNAPVSPATVPPTNPPAV